MLSDSRGQVRLGLVLTVAVLLLIAILAYLPDPLHRQRVLTVGLDQVEGIKPGAPVFFRGTQIGSVRDVALVPDRRTFDVRVGVQRDWRPSACSFMTVAAANPFTQPHLELVALERSAAQCPAARAAAACLPIIPAYGGRAWLPGCKRSPDLIALATAAVTQAADVAKTAGAMATKLQGMMGAGGGPLGAGEVGGDLKNSVRDLSGLLADLNRSMVPGRGDLALTMANVRRATGQASRLNLGAINGTLGDVREMVAENRAPVGRMVANGAAISTQTSDLLQASSRSLADTSANLARMSGSMDALVEHMASDPTYAIRGQRFADPPPVAAR